MNLKLLFFILLITFSSFAQNKNKTIGFKENKGQIIDQKGKPNNTVKYLLNSGGLNVQLKKNGFSYDVYEAKKHPINHSRDEKSKPLPFPSKDNDKLPDYTVEYQFHRIDIDFLNSNPKVELITEEKSLDYDNYYNIPNKPEGVLMVHQYKQITYKNIYPNIDVVFSVPKDTLKTVEYNFVVHPKGKISDIQLKFSGAQTELVDNKIRMSVRFGEMEETLPMSWTEDGKNKKEITVGYAKIKNNVYGFESTENLSNKTVIIDPVPTRLWGTYYGGDSSTNKVSSINTDSQENVVMTGETNSSNNIATTGAFITNNNDYTTSGFIVKFNSIGQRIWGSYIKNGNLSVEIFDSKINSIDQIYIAGKAWDGGNGTNSLATPNSHKTTPSFSADGFILKLNSNGIREWGTFFGGNDYDYINSILLDDQENLIISGLTNSNNGITTQNSYLPNYPSNSTFTSVGFFCKFSPSGIHLYGSYYYLPIEKITKDLNNNYYLSGIYQNNNNYPKISTSGSYQEQNYSTDVYLTKLNSNLNLLWCTYYGGNRPESLTGIGTDNQNNIYLVGNTSSIENISTSGAYKEVLLNNATNTFIVKFNTSGQRIFGTYFGRNETVTDDISKDCYINKDGNIYVGGTTRIYQNSTELSTPNSFQEKSNGSDEGFFTKLDPTGHLIWSSYYGTPSQDFIQKLYYKNHLYIAGYSTGVATNGNNLGTPGTHMPIGGGSSTFIAKFQDCLSNPLITSNSPICVGNALELKASGGTNYTWTGPNGFTSTDQNPIISNTTASNIGKYSCNITGTGGCDGVFSVDVIVGDIAAPIPNITTLSTILGDCHTTITTIPTATDACAGLITATTTSPLSYSLPGTYTVVWDYDDGNNNISHQNQTVTISTQPLPTANSPQSFCIQQNATLNDIAITTGQNLKWYDALTNGNLLANNTLLQNGITYYASQTINGCESERIPVAVNITNTVVPTGDATKSFCSSQNSTLSTIAVVGTTIKWYDSPTLGNLLTDNTPLVDGKTYFATQTENNCESTNRLAVTVSLISSLPANDYDLSICDDLNDGIENVKLEDFNTQLISNTTNYNFSYYKSLPDAENELTANKITTVSNYKLALGENKIYVRINSNTPCYAIAVLKFSLFSKPFIPIQDIVPICENKSILIDAGIGADNYLWSNGATTQTITIDNPGSLSVTVTKNHGTISCSSDKSFTVKTSNIAKISSIETRDWTDNNNTITVFVTGLGDYEYSIDGTNYQANNLFSGVNSGEYKIYVRDKNGCGTATEEVYLLMYPKFFTPNGDGYNDTWKIKSSDNEKNLTFKIFDRFGKLLKELDSNSNGWDGTYAGQPLPATDYWFVVTRENGKEYKGHFSLKR